MSHVGVHSTYVLGGHPHEYPKVACITVITLLVGHGQPGVPHHAKFEFVTVITIYEFHSHICDPHSQSP